MIFLSKKIGKAISVLTAAALMICLSHTSVFAETPEGVQQMAEAPEAVQQMAEAPEAEQSGEGQLEEEGYGEAELKEEDAQAASNNLHYHTYFGSWIDRPYSFLYEQGGEYVRVEYISGDADSRDEYQGTIHIEHYTKDLEFKSGMSLPLELPVFGGFYKGKDALYLAEGKKNPNDDPNQEVIRVIKYDFSWNRLGAVTVIKHSRQLSLVAPVDTEDNSVWCPDIPLCFPGHTHLSFFSRCGSQNTLFT